MQGVWLLAMAIVLEVLGTTCMKLSDGLTKVGPSLGIAGFYAGSFICLALALKHVDVSVAYAIWAGLGIVLVTCVGVLFFREPMTLWRAGCILLVLLGAVGLNFSHR